MADVGGKLDAKKILIIMGLGALGALAFSTLSKWYRGGLQTGFKAIPSAETQA